MTPHSLAAFGLHLHSGLPIPGAQPAPRQPSPDVTVTVLPTSPAAASDQPGPETHLGPYTLAPDSLLFTMPLVAAYRCSRLGDRITIHPQPGTSTQLVAEYLVSTALPALLWCRDVTVLHAAAAVLPGHNVAFALAGPSGIGKSSLLQRLLAAGATAVADDSLALRTGSSGQPVASGLPSAARLTRAGQPARFLPVPHAQQLLAAPLTHLVELVPEAGPETEAGPELAAAPERQHGSAALAVLLRNLHRPRVPHLLGQDAALLHRLSRLAGALSIYRWSARSALRCSPADLLSHLELHPPAPAS